LREAREAAGSGPRFVSLQNQYSLLARYPEDDGTLEVCEELAMGFLPFYPLANGLLTGKVRPGQPLPEGTRLAAMAQDRQAHWLSSDMRDHVESLITFADSQEVPLLSLAFSWLLSHRAVSSVIAGASNAQQVRSNALAVRDLDTAQLARLDEITADLRSL
jgi:aryl-alcohol dehydrogenase-like predicted oxidoreductase